MNTFINTSLELHLFFARIMKEHAIFLQASFMPKNIDYSKEAEWYQREFETLLCETVKISNGMVGKDILCAGEIITDYTLEAERKTQCLTGILIDSNITLLEKKLQPNCGCYVPHSMDEIICTLNHKICCLLDGFIKFKEKIITNVNCCNLFTANYPLLLNHILKEAKLYYYYVDTLQNTGKLDMEDIKQKELFWDDIMKEHALFIRGMLDPTEETLICTANEFANTFKELIEEAKMMTDEMVCSSLDKTITETVKLRDFKEAGLKGISECHIKSTILPLLADHVLREANHYLRILRA